MTAPGPVAWRISALDVRLAVQVDDAELADSLLSLTSALTTHEPVTHDPAAHHLAGHELPIRVRGSDPWTVESFGHRAVAGTPAAARSSTLTAVNLTAIAATPHLALHAAVMARDSAAVVLTAPSGTGKSTLAACLAASGWTYVSDEALVMRWDDGALVPYRRALALSPWAASIVGVTGLDGDSEVLLPAPGGPSDPVVVRHVVVLERRDGPAELVGLHRADAFARLLRRGFTVHRQPRRGVGLLADVVRRSQTWTLRLGDPLAGAELLGQLR